MTVEDAVIYNLVPLVNENTYIVLVVVVHGVQSMLYSLINSTACYRERLQSTVLGYTGK